MIRSLLIDFRSDSPIDAHPPVRALLDEGWDLVSCALCGSSGEEDWSGPPRVLIRLIRQRSRGVVRSR